MIDTLGIASIMPFLAILGNQELVESSPILYFLYQGNGVYNFPNINSFLTFLCLASFSIIVSASFLRIVINHKVNRFTQNLRHKISLSIFDRYLQQNFEFFLSRKSSDLMKNVLSEADLLVGHVYLPLLNMFSYLILCVSVTMLLLILYPTITILLFTILGGAYFLAYVILRDTLQNLGKELFEVNEARFRATNNIFNSIKYIKLRDAKKTTLEAFTIPSMRYSEINAQNITISQSPKYIIEALAFGGLLLIILYFLSYSENSVDGNLITLLPLLGIFSFSAYKLQPAFQYIFWGFSSLNYGKAALAVLGNDLNLAHNKQKHGIDIPFTRFIRLSSICFNYPNRNEQVFTGLNVEIKCGSVTAIWGPSGSGKTTLIDILLGLLVPQSGTYYVDEVEITQSNIASWQESIGYVPQEVLLTDATVAENIAFNFDKKTLDMKKIKACAKAASLEYFIENDLENGYDTIVGERGSLISGGQRQRVGIARALYNDPKVLILDEATSALDMKTEELILNSVTKFSKSMTIIMISHNERITNSCDEIIKLENIVGINAKNEIAE